MNCYFCQYELIKQKSKALYYQFYDPCPNCSNQNDILNVYTSKDYCQIYVGVNYKIINIPGSFPMSNSCLELGRKYQIRLHLHEGFTNICETTGDTVKELFKVPGFPFTPQNAKEKLSLYLTFS